MVEELSLKWHTQGANLELLTRKHVYNDADADMTPYYGPAAYLRS